MFLFWLGLSFLDCLWMSFLHSSMAFNDSRTNWTRNWKKKARKQFIQYPKRKNWSSNWRYKYVLVKTTSFDFIFCCRPRHVNKCWRRQRPEWRIFVISCWFRMNTIEILTGTLAKQNYILAGQKTSQRLICWFGKTNGWS